MEDEEGEGEFDELLSVSEVTLSPQWNKKLAANSINPKRTKLDFMLFSL